MIHELDAGAEIAMDLTPDSDGETGSETQNSSQSSMSGGGGGRDDVRSSSFSRLSFDTDKEEARGVELQHNGDRSHRPCSPLKLSPKPHRSSDPAWAAIRSRSCGNLGPSDFELVRRIGSGDVGVVYLCRLREESGAASGGTYAMKVVDKRALAKKKKLERAATERRILRVLDHPFLPSLYADFDASTHYSCVVMEYCSGGDLHTLRHRQPGLRFSLAATRFYAGEVLLALEYLHMIGIVYRDLKPENILIRSDGHIMLSDFDLSLESTSSPTVERLDLPACTSSSPDADASFREAAISCIPARLFRRRKSPAASARRFVAEPIGARSCSFVGTHEYVAPEVAAGRPHGSSVDWWTYGVLLYELLYGRTPFAGPTNEATLRSVVSQPLAFPPAPLPAHGGGPSESAARDLIATLLVKDPRARLGSRRGSADVKGHRFFKGLNLALLRSCRPPVVPGLVPSRSLEECQEPVRVDLF